jgi:hypothetical protein
VLQGIDINKVEQKYGISTYSLCDESIPNNTTKIDELEDVIKKTPEIVSFLDETKRLVKCNISMIDFNSNQNIMEISRKKYKCFWDKNYIPDNVKPIGCPIKYVPNKAVKTYFSEISKEKYVINENITVKKTELLSQKNDNRINIEYKNYYQTDGIFCSFNCLMAFIQDPENRRNPIYRYSESLLLKMYSDLNPQDEFEEIIPAPHWRNLIDFGGNMTIDKFRETFNKINYTEHGIICFSIGKLYEDQIKF